VHKQFVLLFCRAALGNPPQVAYSSFPLQSAGEFCGCVQQKWKNFGEEIVQPREWARI
jgi:hypothetical protein